jgi:hypothetical protein
MAGDQDLVVREELFRPLSESRLGVVWDVYGISGAGKSTLLRDVERRAGEHDVVVLVELRDYFTAFERGNAAGRLGDPAGDLRRFQRVLAAVMNGLRDKSPRARAAVENILNDIGRTVQKAGSLDETEADELAAGLAERLRWLINGMIVNRSDVGGRVYVLFDGFDLVIDRPVGKWLLRLLDGLDDSVAAVARQVNETGTAPLLEAAGLTEFGEHDALEVGAMTAEQVREYLTRRLGGPGEEISPAVHQFTGGHALAVGLTADLVADVFAEMQRRGQPVTIDGPVKRLIEEMEAGRNDEPDVRIGRLVDRFIKANNPDPAVRLLPDEATAIGKGLECLWVVRRFDFPLLRSLLSVGEGPTGGFRLAERLVGYSFVEQRTPPGRPGEQYYVVHDRVRQQGLRNVAEDRRKELVKVAHDFYHDKATETLESYDRWFRYEDPGWQTVAREWLYYVAQLQGDDRRAGRLGAAILFVDAWWWWGSYVPYPFCEQLLADWAEMADAAQDTTDRGWGDWLRDLYLLYPKGWNAEASTDDWTALQQRLQMFLFVRPELRNEKIKRIRHVRGLLYVYLADAERFLDPRSPVVEENLRKARELFTANNDEWNVAWVSYQEAAAALGRGDAAAAVAAADTGWADLTAMTGDEEETEDDDETEVDDETEDDGGLEDYELAANLHRIHADAAWLRGEGGLSLDLYARAALSAYKFQIDIANPDIPPVDEYTQAFMTEIHERAAERLNEMHEAGQDSVMQEACARIRRFFDPYWRAVGEPGPVDPAAVPGLLGQGRAERVIAGLFPPPPAPADLHQLSIPYALTAGGVTTAMDEELAQPPGTPLPPVAE